MAPANPVQKLAPDHTLRARKKRGRPNTWTESWQKKLVVLRMCGLHLREILALLSKVSDGNFSPKNRRAEQILRKLLSNGYQKYCSADSATLRRRVAYLRHLKPRKRHSEKHSASNSTPTSLKLTSNGDGMQTGYPAYEVSRSETPPTMDLAPPLTSLPSVARRKDVSLSHNYLRSPIEHAPNPPRRSPGSLSLFPIQVERTLASLNMPPLLQDTDTLRQYSVLNNPCDDSCPPPKEIDTISNVDRRSRQYSEIFRLLRSENRTDSWTSGIMSLLSRFSLSSSSGSQRSSTISASSTGNTHVLDREPDLTRILPDQTVQFKRENTKLIASCCSLNYDCIHRRLANAAFEDWTDLNLSTSDVNTIDSSGNNLLFFAARSGASPAIVFTILRAMTNINATNAEGETFLFALDPGIFTSSPATDRYLAYDFISLVKELENRNFNFEHRDHYGRSALSLLVARPSFRIEWLHMLLNADDRWPERFGRIARRRDSSGAHLAHYIIQNHDAMLLHDVIIDVLAPGFRFSRKYRTIGALKEALLNPTIIEEDREGRSPLHQHLISDSWQLPALLGSRSRDSHNIQQLFLYRRVDVNNYDKYGSTPLMSCIQSLSQSGETDASISPTLNILIENGANIHARDRAGNTALHYAAKGSVVGAIQLLLDHGADVNHPNLQGDRPLDLAGKTYKKSTQIYGIALAPLIVVDIAPKPHM
ncbi:ankyrin [Lepidopterella palustris CBS 459.81]|uniref:Ankyrin n=1 Tax=Lepidopterella palustris CBS 459.81 TaxID=1314670 RepID=A0A8E2EJN5_9PEZI|nr:ankyrin [Lepidopterella palustris CBS 459.81]